MRSIRVKLFGVTVYEYQDDSGENMFEALRGLVDDAETEPDDGRFVLAPVTDAAGTYHDGPDGRVILSPDEITEEDLDAE